jgi:hypothetical protein
MWGIPRCSADWWFSSEEVRINSPVNIEEAIALSEMKCQRSSVWERLNHRDLVDDPSSIVW